MNPSAVTIAYGYTLQDLDAMTRAAVRADRSLASDAHTRFDVAWSAIALALAEAPHWPTRQHLIQVGWQAIYTEVKEMRHTYGFADKDGIRGVASSPRFREYWWHGTTSFEDGLTERLALPAIMATLTDAERAAVVALAVHDDYQAAADALGLKTSTLTVRLSAARRRFYRRWYAPDVPPRVKGTDRRIGAYGRALATHCGNGHEWTPENTRYRKDRARSRTCRMCERTRDDMRRAS